MLVSPSDPNDAAKLRRGEPGASVGIFLALLAGLFVFSHASTALLRYPDRAIGVGLVNGVDPARRFPIYLGLVAVVLGVWLACHYGARFLRRWRPAWFIGVRSRLENDLAAQFAAVGCVALVARVAADRLDGLGPTLLCLGGMLGVLALALVRRLAPALTAWRKHLVSLDTLAVALLATWPAVHIGGVLGDVRASEGAPWVLAGMVLVPVAFLLVRGHCLRRPGRATPADVSRAFVVAAAPLFAFPIACPIANEIQYSLARREATEPRGVALWMLLLLVGLSALAFWLARGGKLRWSPSRVLARWVYPAVIFGETLLGAYQHTLRDKRIDPLHDGEQITAVHQLLTFDKWPFVDIWPAHGLFDYVGALYSLANGFRPLELTAWNGLLSALSATAAYAILASIATPLFAFLVAALLPLEAVLPLPLYSFFYAEPGLLAVGLLACVVLRRPTIGGSVLLSLATFLCFFWTPTSGVASIAAVLGLIVLGLVTTGERRPLWHGLAVFVATGVVVFAAYLLVLLLRGQPVLDTLRLIRAFMQADPLIGGRPSVLKQFDAPAFVQYLILPGIGIVYLTRLARHALERRPLAHADRLLAFLTAVSFVLFARTLTRHGIIERYQPFYFVFLALCAWMPRRSGWPLSAFSADAVRPEGGRGLAAHFWPQAGARAWFCAGLALYLVWLPQASYEELEFEPFRFQRWRSGEQRFRGTSPSYPELGAFLGATLRPTDTFLELLNMPVLYGLFNREVPGQFFLPTMFYATDAVQSSYIARLEAFGRERVPVVLLPEEKGRVVDKIDNALRSYRIAEYVYRHYVPLGTFDGFEVWISRESWDAAARASRPRPLPFRDPSSYRSFDVEPPRLEENVLHITTTGADPRVADVVEVAGVPAGGVGAHHAVRLSYRSSVAGRLELFYRFGAGKYRAGVSGRARLSATRDGEWRSVDVPIPAQADPKLALTGVRIDPPEGARLEVKDLTLVFGAPAGVEEPYVVGMLPFFWGSFDERHASDNPVLEAIEVPHDGQPRAAFDLKFRPVTQEASGNYLKVCVRLPGLGSPQKSGRWQTVKHEGSWQRAGKVTLTYGSPSTSIVFDLVRPTPGAPGLPEALARSFAEECKPYLIRVSAQYTWNSQAVSSIGVASSVPIVLESASLLAGD